LIVARDRLRLVGRVPRRHLESGAMLRLEHPPFHVLVAMVDGKPCAIEDACNHAGASLTEGERQGECVSCPMHGYRFELATGRLIAPAGLCPGQRRFVADLVGEDVVVWDDGAGVVILGP
jgi:nitrite reductase/ring-hydroxylating ferredoxin subunit